MSLNCYEAADFRRQDVPEEGAPVLFELGNRVRESTPQLEKSKKRSVDAAEGRHSANQGALVQAIASGSSREGAAKKPKAYA